MNTNIGRPEEFPLTELNTRRLRTRVIPGSPTIVPPRSSSVPLDRLTDDEASASGLMTLTMTMTGIWKKC